MVQIQNVAPHQHHTIKLYAIIRNSVDKYKLLIIFVIYQYISDFQQFANSHKIASFKYCPGHKGTHHGKNGFGFPEAVFRVFMNLQSPLEADTLMPFRAM